MMSDAELVLSFSPPLVTVLLAAERSKGSPLTEQEVLALRDDAVCMSVSRALADALAESRGYDDIDPEFCWPQWQAIRAGLQG